MYTKARLVFSRSQHVFRVKNSGRLEYGSGNFKDEGWVSVEDRGLWRNKLAFAAGPFFFVFVTSLETFIWARR